MAPELASLPFPLGFPKRKSSSVGASFGQLLSSHQNPATTHFTPSMGAAELRCTPSPVFLVIIRGPCGNLQRDPPSHNPTRKLCLMQHHKKPRSPDLTTAVWPWRLDSTRITTDHRRLQSERSLTNCRRSTIHVQQSTPNCTPSPTRKSNDTTMALMTDLIGSKDNLDEEPEFLNHTQNILGVVISFMVRAIGWWLKSP